MELAADICPNQYGSSTGGVIKSTVFIIAISSEILYTAASSEVSKPTIRLGSDDGVKPFSASDKSVGPILAAQPQVLARPVSDFFLNKRMKNSPIIKKTSCHNVGKRKLTRFLHKRIRTKQAVYKLLLKRCDEDTCYC